MPLTANAAGQITGSFTIPSNVPVGTKRVTFTGNQGSFGAARFIGSGTIVTRNQRELTTIETRYFDPLAQTFRLDQGRYVTSIEFKFTARGSTANRVFLEIRETELGLPNSTTIAEGVIQGSAIQTTGWTKIPLKRPVFLSEGVEYAMVLLTDDPIHAVGLAELGRLDTASGAFVTSQPYTIGTLLKSSNASTWTPVQEADLTFKMYGALFTSTSRTINLGTLTAATVNSITRSGTTATLTTIQDHNLVVSGITQRAVISGANQAEYNGAFDIVITGPKSFTYTVSGSPATPATGNIVLQPGDTTDLVALAGVERPTNDASVQFVFTKPDGTEIRGSENARIQLAETINVPLSMSAVLTGTSKVSPYLFAGTQGVLGKLRQFPIVNNYITRAMPCAANAKVTMTFEAMLPGGSSILVQIQKADETWQTVTLTSSTSIGDGWIEYTYTVSSFTAGGTTTRGQLRLYGTAVARPQVRQFRMVVI